MRVENVVFAVEDKGVPLDDAAPEPRLVLLLLPAGVPIPVLPGGNGSCKVGEVIGDIAMFSLFFINGVLATLPLLILVGNNAFTPRVEEGAERGDETELLLIVRSQMLVRENLKADKSGGGTQCVFSFS